MKKLLLVYPPFCTPASPPYSITNLYSLLKNSLDVSVLDLNVEFHELFFKEYQEYFKKKDWENYSKISTRAREDFNSCYSKNHKLILKEKKPEGFDYLLELILRKKPEVVAFSIVYSSQVFYTYTLIKKLKELKIKTIVGGPAVSDKLAKEADSFLENEEELSKYLNVKIEKNNHLDFTIYPLNKYFTPEIVLPLKTSNTCYYKQCSFCSHYTNQKYQEYFVESIQKTLKKNKAKHYFIIDDMIHSKRLLELSDLFKKYKINWACQLKPTKNFTKEVMQELKKSGLKFVMWGVESGNDRVLNLMKKNTKTEDMALILKNSKESGVINTVYIMFGFPSETKKEFLDTINFLKKNEENIDLVLSSVFGLQKRSKVYEEPKKFCINKIFEEPRTLLDPKISYEITTGLTTKEAAKLRKSYLKTLDKINKFPRKTNFFREHMFFY